MSTATRSQAQHERQRTRSRGKYAQGPICELCGKSAGFDYGSAPNGDPLVVCARKKCADALTVIGEAQMRAEGIDPHARA